MCLVGSSGSSLAEFRLVDDRGTLLEDVALTDADTCAWGCGLFRFLGTG